MVAKQILYNNEARQQIAHGLNALANVVKVTLGPRGRNVILAQQFGAPTISKDGVTVAKQVQLEDHFANMGAQMVKEVASKTSDVAGDGTTTATVLTQSIYTEGAKLVAAGANPMEIKRGIEAAVATVVAELQRHSRPIEGKSEIEQVASISANGDAELGKLLADAMEKVGKQGVVTVEQGTSMVTTLKVAEGMQFDEGYISPYFVTDSARMEVVLQDAFILIHDKKLSKIEPLVPILEKIAGTKKSLLLVAEDVDSEVLATLLVNKLRGLLSVCAVKAPGFGNRRRELAKDIAVVTGGQAVSEELGLKLENLTLEDLGCAQTITISKDRTIIVQAAGKQQEIQARVRQLETELEQSSSDYDREKLQERLAKLAGGVAVISVGAASELEVKEKKARLEDALHATRAAVQEGVVPGGGVALLRTLPALQGLVLSGEQQYGVNVIRRALEEPLRQMAQNAGVEGSVVVNAVCAGSGAYGYNVAAGKYEDRMARGIIDPTKVVRVALQHATSVASLMLTTEALVAQRKPAKKQKSTGTEGMG